MSLVKGSRKTNAMRILESLGIRYEVASYPMGDEHLDAAEVSRILGVSAEVVFKTLVARNERGEPLVFCVRGDRELDLRKAAKAAGRRESSWSPCGTSCPSPATCGAGARRWA